MLAGNFDETMITRDRTATLPKPKSISATQGDQAILHGVIQAGRPGQASSVANRLTPAKQSQTTRLHQISPIRSVPLDQSLWIVPK